MSARIKAWFDGVCEPVNPGGHAAFGAAVVVDGMTVLATGGYVGNGALMSNNCAEYSGFIAAAEECMKHAGVVIIRGDSKLVVNQLQGLWKVNGGLYMPYYQRAIVLWSQLKIRTRLEWIPRDQNEVCDDLSKQVLRDRGVQFRIQPEAK
jgi:ribonuclease HI